MSRSAKKGPYVDEKLLKKVDNPQLGTAQNPIMTWARASQVHPKFVGKWLKVHKGNGFVSLYVTEEMVGHRIGEFALTRNFKGHGKVVKRTLEKT